MAGPSPVNSACNCCFTPPNLGVNLQYASASQSCTAGCGEAPCTSTPAVYDEDGNCTTPAQACTPNYAELTRAEKCAAKRYLTITTEDLSGGFNHGRTQVREYTIDEDGNCDLETTCSGTVVTETVETGEYTGPSGGPTPACSSQTITGGSEATTTETKTWNNDCTTTNEVDCEGSSNFTYTCVGLFGGEETIQCNSNFINIDESCQWQGFIDGDVEFNDNCLEATLLGGQYELVSETTITPEPQCQVAVTYSQPNQQGFCTPQQFPSFPAFTQCTPEGEEPSEPQELEGGQGYESEAYKYENPNNPQIKSEQRVRYRVEHGPTASCYLKVWFRKKIQQWKFEDCDSGFAGDPPRTNPITINCNENGSPCFSRWSTDGEPTYEDDGTYEWNASGYPCYAENDKPPSYCVNKFYSSEVKNLTAEKNHSITIEFKYSEIKDYEPNWPDENGSQGCKPNRFPIPDPEDCPEYNP